MIYTVTFNPSLDLTMDVPDCREGSVNRAVSENILPGGKGINVSIVLGNLGMETTALGFTAGFVGKEIERRLSGSGVRTDFIELSEGTSRINVLVRADRETKVNGCGPEITEKALGLFFEKIDRLSDGDTLVLAGSIPSSISDSIYEDIMKRLSGRGVMVAVDATGDLLMNVLPLHPFVIKPNHHELGEIFGVSIKSWEEAVPYARKVQEMGARNVIVSMGSLGAMMVAEDGKIYHDTAVKGKVVNTVGAGDSFMAGFLFGCKTFGDYEKAFYIGNCTGGASAQSESLAKKEDVIRFLRLSGRDYLG